MSEKFSDQTIKSLLRNREIWAIIVSILFLILGFIVVQFSRYFNLKSDTIILALLLMPIVTYGISARGLSRLKVGVFEIGFASASVEESKSYTTPGETILYQPGEVKLRMRNVTKKDYREVKERLFKVGANEIIVLSLVIGEPYEHNPCREFVKELSQLQNFKIVMLLTHKEEYFACMAPWKLVQILEDKELSRLFLDAISNSNGAYQLVEYFGAKQEAVLKNTTNIEALKSMVSHNLDALAVLDEKNKLIGVVERNQIISKLLLELA
jgi:CBS domain-containing protein